MKVNSNIQAQIANSVLKANEEKYSSSTERMSAGYKINHAMDAPAGMAISNRMNAQLKSLSKAKQNASNAVNVVQIAEGSLAEMQAMVQRINELAIKAANGSNTDADRQAIQDEIEQLTDCIDDISKDTEYNTQCLLNGDQSLKGYSDNASVKVDNYDEDFVLGNYTVTGITVGTTVDGKNIVTGATVLDGDGNDVTTSLDAEVYTENGKTKVTLPNGAIMVIGYDPDTVSGDANLEINGVGGLKIQTGSAQGQEVQVVIPKVDASTIGFDGIDVRTQKGAQFAIDKAKMALEQISRARSKIGAYQNRLESVVSNLDQTMENLTQAYSTIKDLDMADEMVEYTKLQVLVQAGTNMLTQANEQPQQALQLLQ